ESTEIKEEPTDVDREMRKDQVEHQPNTSESEHVDHNDEEDCDCSDCTDAFIKEEEMNDDERDEDLAREQTVQDATNVNGATLATDFVGNPSSFSSQGSLTS